MGHILMFSLTNFRSTMACLFMSFLSGLISVYDNVLNVVYFESLEVSEQNPLASMIIYFVGVEGLVTIKATTTILAVLAMCVLSFTKWKIVILPVFLFQLGLFLYLSFYAPTGMFETHDLLLPISQFFEFYLK